jgi:hypothetical protein
MTKQQMTFVQFAELQQNLTVTGWQLHTNLPVEIWGHNNGCSCGFSTGITLNFSRFNYVVMPAPKAEFRTFDICPACWGVSEILFDAKELTELD